MGKKRHSTNIPSNANAVAMEHSPTHSGSNSPAFPNRKKDSTESKSEEQDTKQNSEQQQKSRQHPPMDLNAAVADQDAHSPALEAQQIPLTETKSVASTNNNSSSSSSVATIVSTVSSSVKDVFNSAVAPVSPKSARQTIHDARIAAQQQVTQSAQAAKAVAVSTWGAIVIAISCVVASLSLFTIDVTGRSILWLWGWKVSINNLMLTRRSNNFYAKQFCQVNVDDSNSRWAHINPWIQAKALISFVILQLQQSRGTCLLYPSFYTFITQFGYRMFVSLVCVFVCLVCQVWTRTIVNTYESTIARFRQLDDDDRSLEQSYFMTDRTRE